MPKNASGAVIVTGAASGIGQAVALAFLGRGLDVIAPYFDVPIEETETKAAKLAGRLTSGHCDVGDVDGVNRFFDEVVGSRRVDVLIANAGILLRAPFVEMSEDLWQRTLAVDLSGVFRFCRRVVPMMIEQRYGRIICTSSVAGSTIGWPGMVAYSSAKAGLQGFARSLAVELAPFGITVNVICPGTIRSRQSTSADAVGEEGIKRAEQLVMPMGRVGEPSDVVPAFLFFAAPENSYTTGQVLFVDGGMSLGAVPWASDPWVESYRANLHLTQDPSPPAKT